MAERTTKAVELERVTKAVVLFDIDNTLVNGFSIMRFARHLFKRKVITSRVYTQLRQDMKLPKNTHEEYTHFAVEIVSHFYSALKGKPSSLLEGEGKRFLQDYQKHLKPFARELVEKMNGQGQTIAVSGAPKEAFLPLAEKLEIQKAYLLEGEIANGIYTGAVKVNMALGHEKEKAVAEIIEGEFDRQFSFAFGDSSHDLPILLAVDHRFIVGRRDLSLVDLATSRGWPIVDNRNIIRKVSKRISELQALREKTN